MTDELLIQGSPEWLQARVGKATASRIADVVARTKTGWGASRANYMAELVAERLTGVPAEGYVSEAMRRGTATEPEARAAYEFYTDVTVEPVGFVPHPTIEMAGASPDGLVGEAGLVEVKCPGTAVHIETLLGQTIPQKYALQMSWQMACTGRQWCDFVSYDPRMPEDMRLYIRRYHRSDEVIAGLEAQVRAFLAETDALIAELQAVVRGREEAA